MPTIRLSYYCSFFILAVFVVAACKKSSPSTTTKKTTAVLTISYTGGSYVGGTVNFSSSAGSSGTFTWSFGDGSTSTSPAPAHIYTATGSYPVTLVHNSLDSATATLHIGADSAKTTAVLTISYTGGSYVGGTVNFSSSAGSSGTFAWYFGDGSTSTSPAPAHIYTATGSYPVTLVHNSLDTATATLHFGADSAAMAMLPGTRLFHRSHYVYVQSMTDTTYPRTDTNITLQVIDPTTIVFGNDTLSYGTSSYLTTYGFIEFYHNITKVVGGIPRPTGSWTRLNFYPATDSISYLYHYHWSAASHSEDNYWTP